LSHFWWGAVVVRLAFEWPWALSDSTFSGWFSDKE
jgi:hypothetical protein